MRRRRYLFIGLSNVEDKGCSVVGGVLLPLSGRPPTKPTTVEGPFH